MKRILLLCGLVFISCQNQATKQEKQRKQAEDYFNLNRKELAEKCKLEFPTIPIEIIKGDTIYKDVYHIIEGEEIECPISDVPTIVKCPDVKVKETTKYVTDTIRVKDMAEVYSYEVTIKELTDRNERLQLKYEQQSLDLDKEKNSKRQYQLMFGLLALFVALYIIFKVKKVF